MKNYLNFETDVKNLESEIEKLKDPYNQSGLSEVDTNKISQTQMNKLLALLDCYDLSDVAYDFLHNSPKYINNSELNSQIKEILKKRIESNYRNYNPLNIK